MSDFSAPVRIAMIGVGGIAAMHLTNLLRMPSAEVVGLADIDANRIAVTLRRSAAQQNPSIEPPEIPAFNDVEKMLNAVSPDAVILALPPFAHGEVEFQCVEAGLPMLVQKPVGLDMETVRAIEQKISDRGLISAVGYQARYSHAADIARSMLADRPVGMAVGTYLGGLPGTPWWRVQARSGGQVVEQATHVVDLQRYLVGEIETVQAVAATRLMTDVENLDIADVSVASLVFDNGAIGTLINSSGLNGVPKEPWDHGLRLVARDLSFHVFTDGGRIATAGETRELVNPEDCKYLLDEAFVKAVATGDSSHIRSTYSDAVLTLRATLAINESARTGELVRVADLG